MKWDTKCDIYRRIYAELGADSVIYFGQFYSFLKMMRKGWYFAYINGYNRVYAVSAHRNVDDGWNGWSLDADSVPFPHAWSLQGIGFVTGYSVPQGL